jgi:hypothetical protein
MNGPSQGLTPEEIDGVIEQLQQRWREAGDGEKERLAWISDLLVRVLAEGAQAPPDCEAAGRSEPEPGPDEVLRP